MRYRRRVAGPTASRADAVAQRALLEEGRRVFNLGQFFAAHEHWEAAWLQLTGDQRVAVQGLIQVAAGLHHLVAGRPRPAQAQLGKGLAKLASGLPPALSAWNIAAVIEEVARVRDGLAISDASAPALPELHLSAL
jgi:predicted metal-dependent hydrolase